MTKVYEVQRGKTMDSGNRERKSAFHVERVVPNQNPVYLFMKRSLDILLALVGIALLLVLFCPIAVAIKLDSPGPVLFLQERLGKDGKAFAMYKFRSMRMDAEAVGPQWAEKGDARCTRVGRFLRKLELDELPQALNILKGEMSVVGPRPERACFYDQFERHIHGFRYRLAVRPGLTGWAQVHGGYDLKPEEKICYDMEYIQNQSMILDLQCILKTIHVLFTHEGVR